MRVQIIGLGTEGKAHAHLMKKLGHEVTAYDNNPTSCPGIMITDSPVSDADLTFLCLPVKTIPNALSSLAASKVRHPFVIKGAVPPGTTQAAMLEHGVHICYNPSFSGEDTDTGDATGQKCVVIGECCQEHGDLVAEAYAPLGAEIIRATPTISEAARVILDNYLATLVTFWNEADKLCDVLKLDIEDVADIVKTDERVSEYGTCLFGQPFGGKYLPGDLNQALTISRSRGLNLKLFETIKEVNMELSVLAAFRRYSPDEARDERRLVTSERSRS